MNSKRLESRNNLDAVDLRVFHLRDELDVQLTVGDFDGDGFNVGTGAAAGFGPNVKVLERFAFHLKREHPFAGSANAFERLAEMKFHFIFSIRNILAEGFHGIMFGAIDFGTSRVGDRQIGTLNDIAAGEPAVFEPELAAGVFDGADTRFDADRGGALDLRSRRSGWGDSDWSDHGRSAGGWSCFRLVAGGMAAAEERQRTGRRPEQIKFTFHDEVWM